MNEQEFEKLVSKYHLLVMSLINRYYSGRLSERAEDLSQEIWAKLWENLKKNETNVVNFKSYLYRTVQTTLWDAIRQLDKDQTARSLHPEEEIPQSEETDDLHNRWALDQMLAQLKPEESRMMRAHLKGFNTQEIATLMDCSEGRVRNLLSRIRKKLTLMGHGGEDASLT